VGAAGRGLLAGLAATLFLSALSRVMPGMRNRSAGTSDMGQNGAHHPPRPSDPFDPHEVQRWQQRSQSPAGLLPPAKRAKGPGQRPRPGAAPAGAPAGALTQPEAPGPEGLAAQFAYKFALGVFDKDLAGQLRPVGFGVHVLYGSFWGVVFGIVQGTYHLRPGPFGTLYGVLVWLIGPAFLVPAMKLMQRPTEEPPLRTAMMVTGHVAFGLALAAGYSGLELIREDRR
jgi:hypothetical protein